MFNNTRILEQILTKETSTVVGRTQSSVAIAVGKQFYITTESTQVETTN